MSAPDDRPPMEPRFVSAATLAWADSTKKFALWTIEASGLKDAETREPVAAAAAAIDEICDQLLSPDEKRIVKAMVELHKAERRIPDDGD